jgi:hypothetical protein
VVERIGRSLTKALGQMRLDLDQAALKRLEAFRRFDRRVGAHRSLGLARRARPRALSIEQIFQFV